MKFAIAALAALPLLTLTQDDDRAKADEAAVRGAIEDYVLGFYEAAPERLERALSKDLKKMGYWKGGEKKDYGDALHMNYEQALALAKRWNPNGEQGDDLEHEVEVYEVSDKTACGKVTAKWGIDYFHLAKEGDAWKIHHVIWQSHPPEAGGAR